MITISEEAAKVLASLCRQVSLPNAAAKLRVGRAQEELESGLLALRQAAEAKP